MTVPPGVVAHRGLAARFPENTIESLRAAMDNGIRYVEFDVQVTADRVAVLHHDRTLERTAGDPRRIADLALAELDGLRVGETARLGMRYANARLPSLTWAIACIAERAGVHAFVEIKRAAIEAFGRPAVLDAVLPCLEPVAERVTVISFDAEILSLARQRGAGSIGWVLDRWDDLARFRAEAIAPQWLFCNHEKIPPQAPLWRGNWRWVVYEVTDAELALSLRERGADLVESMTPDTLAEALARV